METRGIRVATPRRSPLFVANGHHGPMTEDETPTGTGSAADFVPPDPTLERMQLAVQECRGCGLYARATQAVFGKGTQRAEIMLVGEQPGDKEDLAGEPFVGPSGKLLDTALAEAGIDRGLAYVTNVVEHFKWKSAPSGKRRLHDKPTPTRPPPASPGCTTSSRRSSR